MNLPTSKPEAETMPKGDVTSAPDSVTHQTVEPSQRVPEIGGRRDGTEPTRFGDWEKSGRCIDF